MQKGVPWAATRKVKETALVVFLVLVGDFLPVCV